MEQIRIGSDIRITVVKLDRNQVRLGIEAPPQVTVLRAELLGPDELPCARGGETLGYGAPVDSDD
jgi:carbon storage regulator